MNRGLRVIPVVGKAEKTARHRFDPGRLQAVRIESNEEIVPGVRRLSFARPWDFVAGQSVALTLDPSVPARFYSIASGSSDPMVDVLYDVVPEGTLTPRLDRLVPGDSVLCSKPFGAFRDAEGPTCWIATGTGVAPFLSMVRSGRVEEKMLVHGSRTIGGLFERKMFGALLGGSYVPCCTRESADGVFAGRVTEWLATSFPTGRSRYMLCGNSRMVVDARDLLIGAGVPFTDVVAEIYF
ncbi:MAG TPA: oxidoreductase [Spirochaetia bacterium]